MGRAAKFLGCHFLGYAGGPGSREDLAEDVTLGLRKLGEYAQTRDIMSSLKTMGLLLRWSLAQ